MKDFLEIIKAISDDNRARIVMALKEGELCVCQITELLELAPSTVSKHLSVLKQAELVESRKDGRWIHYRLNSEGEGLVRSALDWIELNLKNSNQVKTDKEKLKSIQKKSAPCAEEDSNK